ncbi:hypothetical protein [Streptomyces omiyaensis]|uniref:Secreted protein n=1 Tax=Streptomyces omiyaensis TaxID=68247 RepID=A0ABW7BWA5_9ACTN|nr:hypothetical protein [Streptomyces omiyaensis]GGY57809.1 hypothetical protein GCM10010363_43940 [Streptomyces omiyaensis]
MTSRSAPSGPPRGPQWGDPSSAPAPGPPAAGGRRSVLTHALAALGGIGVGVLIGIVGSGGGDAADPPAARPAASRDASAPPAEASAAASAAGTTDTTPEATRTPAGATRDGIPGDGTFLVGEEVTPGTYRSAGPAGSSCYWARLAGTTGDSGEIIANGATEGQATVTVLAGDEAFQSTGCQDWKRIG